MIARVFPRRIKATTPDDALAFVGEPPLFVPDGIEKVLVSCLFTWDRKEAERLARSWSRIAPVEIGGPAFDSPAGDFVPGMFVKTGYTITSRGCPNACWFCSVPKREGTIRELPINDGWNLLDSNLLACSDAHIKSVFSMLSRQDRRPEFTGGLEAMRLMPWHAKALRDIKAAQVFMAYDTPDDLPHLVTAGKILLDAGFTRASHDLRCYVLCGWKNDTEEKADIRMGEAIAAGFTPMAMAYRDEAGAVPVEWRRFQRKWARPAIIHARGKKQ